MAEINHERRGTKILKWILIGGAAFVVINVLLVLWAVARTGLVRVPLMSAGYEPPQPTRVVQTRGLTAELGGFLTSSLTSTLANGETRAIVSEGLLTAFIRETLASQQMPDWIEVERAQIAALDRGTLELYLPMRRGENASAIIAEVRPDATANGRPTLQVMRLSIGELTAFAPSRSRDLQQLVDEYLDENLSDVLDGVSISSVEVSEGRLTIVGRLSL